MDASVDTIDYKAEFERERLKRLQLEEECDLLSWDNVRLREENEELKKQIANTSIPSQTRNITEGLESITLSEDPKLHDFLEDGDNMFPNKVLKSIKNACNGKNVIAIAYCCDGKYILCAGADNSIHLYSASDLDNPESWSRSLSAPATSIQSFGALTACTLFDGSLVLLNFENGEDALMETVKDHRKQATGVRWALNGSLLATCSSDQSVNLYAVHRGQETKLANLKTWRFPTTPESICFAPASTATTVDTGSGQCNEGAVAQESASPSELIIGLRDCSELVYMNCTDFSQRQVSLNERAWDSHPSFVPLQLSLSPDRKYLLVATDKSFHFVLRLGTNERVRVLAEHTTGEYGKPRVCWDPTGRYLYCNTDSEHTVYVYSLASERVVSKLSGHTGSVRDMSVHARTLLTCSFDKSVILWTR